MSPWTVLGWILVIVVTIPILFIAGLITWGLYDQNKRKFRRAWKHYRTRNIPPAKGQIWRQDGKNLHIRDVYEKTGRIGITAGSANWGESPEDWRERVRNRKLYLVQ